MNTSDRPEEQRNVQVRRVRRLRVGLVSAGVVGSLGAAAVVGIPSIQAARQGSSGGGSEDQSFSLWQDGASATNGGNAAQTQVRGDDGEGEGEGDGGGGQVQQQTQQTQIPNLQQGFGPSQGTTSGS